MCIDRRPVDLIVGYCLKNETIIIKKMMMILIVVTLVGIVIDVSPEHRVKAYVPNKG